MRRAFSVMALCALPISVVTVGFVGPASASTPATTNIVCKALAGNIATTGTLSKCSDKANTGSKGTFSSSSLTTGSGTITWNGTGSTKVTGVTATANGGTACPAGDTEYAVTGKTGASKGAAAKSIAKGSKLNALVC